MSATSSSSSSPPSSPSLSYSSPSSLNSTSSLQSSFSYSSSTSASNSSRVSNDLKNRFSSRDSIPFYNFKVEIKNYLMKKDKKDKKYVVRICLLIPKQQNAPQNKSIIINIRMKNVKFVDFSFFHLSATGL